MDDLELLLERIKAHYPAERIQDGRDMNFVAVLKPDRKLKIDCRGRSRFEMNEFESGFQTGRARKWSRTAHTVAEAVSLIQLWDSEE